MFTVGERLATPVYQRDDLVAGQTLNGPAIVEQMDATVIIFPGDACVIDDWGNIIITLEGAAK